MIQWRYLKNNSSIKGDKDYFSNMKKYFICFTVIKLDMSILLEKIPLIIQISITEINYD